MPSPRAFTATLRHVARMHHDIARFRDARAADLPVRSKGSARTAHSIETWKCQRHSVDGVAKRAHRFIFATPARFFGF